jgi:hypothetical protein
MPELKNGLWKSPYVKVYSLEGPWRCAEISNYPRAYKDTTPHVYEKNTSFVVEEADLIDYLLDEKGEVVIENGEPVRVYTDPVLDKTFRVGERAIHHKGEPLPGAFPLWLESEELPDPPLVDSKEYTFPIKELPQPVREISEAQIFTDKWEKFDYHDLKGIFSGENATLSKSQPEKVIVRVIYKRAF